MAANLFNRYVWLLDLVSRHNGIPFEQIDKAWQRSHLNDDGAPLPKRTLHNHINAIEEMFDIRIICQRKGGYLYRLEGDDGDYLSEAKESLLNHLKISNALMDNTLLQGRILLDKTMAYKYLNPLLTAMEESKVVRLAHNHKVDNEYVSHKRAHYQFEPYFIKQYREWFVVGRVVEDDTIRIFKFKHISYITLLDYNYRYPSDFSATDFLNNIPLLAEEGMPQIDDREDFIHYRLDDMRYHRSCAGGFIPDEVVR